jgi:hypothetical protein
MPAPKCVRLSDDSVALEGIPLPRAPAEVGTETGACLNGGWKVMLILLPAL